MKISDQEDNNFIDAAADDSRRRAMIEGLARQRKVFRWIAPITTLCALTIAFIDGFEKSGNAAGSALALFIATMNWVLLFKCESDLRLLKLVEMLKK